jgi:hypothetical protein
MTRASGERPGAWKTSRLTLESGQRPIHAAVTNRNRLEGQRRNILHTGNIDAVLGRIASTLVVRVNPAPTAEVVFGDERTPLVQRQNLRASDNPKVINWDAGHDVALSAAKRAITAPNVLKPIIKLNEQLN